MFECFHGNLLWCGCSKLYIVCIMCCDVVYFVCCIIYVCIHKIIVWEMLSEKERKLSFNFNNFPPFLSLSFSDFYPHDFSFPFQLFQPTSAFSLTFPQLLSKKKIPKRNNCMTFNTTSRVKISSFLFIHKQTAYPKLSQPIIINNFLFFPSLRTCFPFSPILFTLYSS